MILEEEECNTHRLNRTMNFDTIKVDIKKFERKCTSAQSSPKNTWNSSTLCEKPQNRSVNNSPQGTAKYLSRKKIQRWYQQQEEYSIQRIQSLERITKQQMKEKCPFKPDLGLVRTVEHAESTQSMSFLDKVKRSIAESHMIVTKK